MGQFEFDHPHPDLIDENSMACDRGCFVCGPPGQRLNHNGTGCCDSTMCSSNRWKEQIKDWLTIEQAYNEAFAQWEEAQGLTAYLKAEEAFREELRAKRKVYVRQNPPTPNNPAKRRGVAVAVRQKQAQEMRAK